MFHDLYISGLNAPKVLSIMTSNGVKWRTAKVDRAKTVNTDIYDVRTDNGNYQVDISFKSCIKIS